jgi:formamidopyrimidine-DNA glycosylase
MPELPEVAGLARQLQELTGGSIVAAAELAAFSVLKTYDPPLADCVGRQVRSVQRRGKFLCWELSDDRWLVVHLARAGWLKWGAEVPARPAAPGRGPLMLRLVFVATSGEVIGRCDMTEAGTRKNSALYVVRALDQVPGIERLGPDPLAADFTADVLAGILTAAGRAQIKGVLRDQSLIAGIGNAYSDEILHAARMSPFRPANGLTAQEVALLHDRIRSVLTTAYDRAVQTPMGDLKDDKRGHLQVHNKAGEQCPVCGDTIREVSFADSALQYCPTCQTGGKPLADRRMSRLLK